MTTLVIDKNKQYRTRDGGEARIYATDGGGTHPVHGAIKLKDGWEAVAWRIDGRLGGYQQTDSDLIEVKPRIKREVWVNVYPNGTQSFGEKRFADEHAKDHRIACVKLTIDVEEGEGL